MKEKIIVVMNIPELGILEDLEVPTEISAQELILALSKIYGLTVSPEQMAEYYLKADCPKALLRGGKTLQEYGLRDGTRLWLWNGALGKGTGKTRTEMEWGGQR